MQLGSVNKTQLTVACIILEIALSVLFYMYYYQPKTLELQELQTIIEKKQRDKREIELTKRNLAETQRDIDYLKREIEHLEQYLPEKVHIPRVLVLIESLATATKLNILTIRPSQAAAASGVAPPGVTTAPGVPTTPGAAPAAPGAAPGPPGAASAKPKLVFNSDMEYRQSVVDFTATGDFAAVINFMRELVSFPKLVVVNHIALSLNTTPNAQGGGAPGMPGSPGAMPYQPKGAPAAQLSVTMPLTFYIQQNTPQTRL